MNTQYHYDVESTYEDCMFLERVRSVPPLISFLSQLYHLIAYSVRKPKEQLENGMIIISIDIDVGSKVLGLLNKGKNDRNVHRHLSEHEIGEIEEQAFPLFIDLLHSLEVPATFAIRGQLAGVGDYVFERLRQSPVRHDIGAHGYYHKRFRNLTRKEAEDELNMISVSMKKFGIAPKSFVFPANSVAHLDLLEKYGYKCYRGYGDFINDCMYIEKQGRLYNIHPSVYLGQCKSASFLKKMLDLTVSRKMPFHVWSHLWNLGRTSESIEESIRKVLFPLLKYAKKEEEKGKLTFETMLSAANTVDKLICREENARA